VDLLVHVTICGSKRLSPECVTGEKKKMANVSSIVSSFFMCVGVCYMYCLYSYVYCLILNLIMLYWYNITWTINKNCEVHFINIVCFIFISPTRISKWNRRVSIEQIAMIFWLKSACLTNQFNSNDHHLLLSRMNQLFERIGWLNESRNLIRQWLAAKSFHIKIWNKKQTIS